MEKILFEKRICEILDSIPSSVLMAPPDKNNPNKENIPKIKRP
jgi:hypothetical protein